MENLQAIINGYFKFFPQERQLLERLSGQIAAGEKLNDRNNWHGHITGSGIVLSPDRTQVLLIHHRLFNKWFQPGGHWESDEEPDPQAAAKREVIEETGVTIAESVPFSIEQPLVPIDIDTHPIPGRPAKHEQDHWHHDFRYVFIAANMHVRHQESEVRKAQWFDLNAPETEHIRGVIDKLRAHKIIDQ